MTIYLTKICSHCHLSKNLDNFNIRKASKDGLMAMCKECYILYRRKQQTSQKFHKWRSKYRSNCRKLLPKSIPIKPKKNLYKEDRSDFRNYEAQVRVYTKETVSKNYIPNIELRGIFGYHLDHRLSMIEGFNNNIPPFIIGSIHNLKMIPCVDNWKKNRKSSLDVNELLEMFYKKK